MIKKNSRSLEDTLRYLTKTRKREEFGPNDGT
nr:unnamed protein product [Callosobruchus chinensis]